jgi:hypothetical protein
MLLDTLTLLPPDHFVPWSFLFTTALLASVIDAFSHRPFNPIVLCIWFFSLAWIGASGVWTAPEFSAALIILATTHMLVCTIGQRTPARAHEARGTPGDASFDDADDHAWSIPWIEATIERFEDRPVCRRAA